MTDPERWQALQHWLQQPPARDLRVLPRVSVPGLATVSGWLPDDTPARVLAAAYTAALRVSGRGAPVAVGDSAAREVRVRAETRRAGWLAAGMGTAFGLAGAAGLVADAPALLVLAMRAVIRIGRLYGVTATPEQAVAVFALATAETLAEKQAAWQQAMQARSRPQAALRAGLERAVERAFAKQALAASVQRLGVVLVQQLGWRRVAGALPVLGAAVGATANAQFMGRVTEAARWVFMAAPVGGTEALPVAAVAALPAPKRRRRSRPPRRLPSPE